MGSQKVPGMVILHCVSNAYLITFTVGPLHTQHLLQLLEAPAEG
jgi:hypothetical protein